MPRTEKSASQPASKPSSKSSPKAAKGVSRKGKAPVEVAEVKPDPAPAKPAKPAKAAKASGFSMTSAMTSAVQSAKAAAAEAIRKSKAKGFTDASFADPPVEVAIEPKASTKKARAASGEISGYQAALRWLHDRADIERMRVVRYSDDAFKLDRMRTLLAKLGNPHEQFRSIHVGGTNGKGATVAMLASMLEGCGYTVGRYTSPHLIDVRERISIDGSPIDRASFTDAIRVVAEASGSLDSQPTFFEVATAAAFKHFAEQAVDIAVIEVGLGGRLDSTNVVTPEVSIVTSIDLDHTRLLGATRQEIAREKAGIFKPGVPALAFDLDNPIDAVMREIANQIGAPFKVVNKDIEFSSRFCSSPDLGPHTRVCLYSQTSRLEHLPVPLPGEHQAGNCGLALAAIDILRANGMDCPEEKVTAGLAKTRVPGRMQVVHERPRVLVDGAHNPAAITALMKCAGAHVPYDSMVCVFGCCSDKDVGAMLDRVNLGADKVIFTRSASNPRAMDPDELQRMFAERSGKMSQVGRTLEEALELANRAVSREDVICITGSFYLVGDAIRHFAGKDFKGDPATLAASAWVDRT
jgi:dihydrofolate synthase / folylpolyglutamate synthase